MAKDKLNKYLQISCGAKLALITNKKNRSDINSERLWYPQ